MLVYEVKATDTPRAAFTVSVITHNWQDYYALISNGNWEGYYKIDMTSRMLPLEADLEIAYHNCLSETDIREINSDIESHVYYNDTARRQYACFHRYFWDEDASGYTSYMFTFIRLRHVLEDVSTNEDSTIVNSYSIPEFLRVFKENLCVREDTLLVKHCGDLHEVSAEDPEMLIFVRDMIHYIQEKESR